MEYFLVERSSSKIVFWEEEAPLGGAGRNVHEAVSLKLAGSFKAGSPSPFLFVIPF